MNVVLSGLCFCISLQLASFGVQSARLEASEAQQIALESENEELLAPASSQLVQNIVNDLKLIRSQYPEVKNITHQGKWVPGQILAKSISDEQIGKINASEYGPISHVKRFTIIPYAVLTFEQLYNPIVLGKRLEKSFGISSDANGSFGRSQIITYDIGNSMYRFEKGSGDCPAGCIEKQWWYFHVSRTVPPTVTLSGTGNNGGASVE